MSVKSGFKTIIEKFLEDSIESSSFLKKISNNVSLLSEDLKKLSEVLITLNYRLDAHEQIIIKLLESQKEKKVELPPLKKDNNDPQKPN